MLLQRIVLTLLFLLPHLVGVAQSFKKSEFRYVDGLPNEIVKSTVKDTRGFLWLGTDDGVFRYDGVKFTRFPQASISNFIKELVRTHDDRIFVVSDLQITELVYNEDTPEFKVLINGSRVKADSTLWYPKRLFYSSSGEMWIAEPQSIVRFKNGEMKRFEFGPEDNSVNFIRSFEFLEDEHGCIITSSYEGNFYIHNLNEDSFEPLKLDVKQIGMVNHIRIFAGNLWIASTQGLFKGQHHEYEEILTVEKVFDNTDISHLAELNSHQLVVPTYKNDLYLLTINDEETEVERIAENLIVLNHAFVDDEKKIYLSSERGLVVFTTNPIQTFSDSNAGNFIESISYCPDKQELFFTSKDVVNRYKDGEIETIFFDEDSDSYFLSSAMVDGDFWVSNTWEIWQFRDGEPIWKKSFQSDGRYIFNIEADKDGDIWFTQEAGIGLKKIDTETYEVEKYGKEKGLSVEITVVDEGPDGVYAGSQQLGSYLFFKPYNEDKFTNISVPANLASNENFRVEDLAFSEDDIWLATSEGVFRYTTDSLERIKLPLEIRYSQIYGLEVDQRNGMLWIGTGNGVFKYDQVDNEFFHYNETLGLPSNTVTTRTILQSDNLLWVGTSVGLACIDDTEEIGKTRKPDILESYANGKLIDFNVNNVFENRSYFDFIFSSLIIPPQEVRYSYRLLGLFDQFTDEISESNISFPDLAKGKYTLEIKAKQIGNHKWSEPVIVEFEVLPAYFETPLFFYAVFVFIVFLIFVTIRVYKGITQKREKALQNLIDERTREIEEVNERLTSQNKALDQFVYSASHDLNAPLKSIQGLLKVMEMEEDRESLNYQLALMSKSIGKLEEFLKELIDYSRNSRLELKKEKISVRDMIKDILSNLSYYQNYDKIKFDISIPDETVVSDSLRLKIIFNNLISNAIKFQRSSSVDDKHWVKLDMQLGKNSWIFTVEDNGIGIEQEYQDKIFDMFFRANSDIEGSGLGLYILMDAIRKLNGNIQLESTPGYGSKFTVEIPYSE